MNLIETLEREAIEALEHIEGELRGGGAALERVDAADLCATYQRAASNAVKRARFMGLLPFVGE